MKNDEKPVKHWGDTQFGATAGNALWVLASLDGISLLAWAVKG